MLFSCTQTQLVTHILGVLAVSDKLSLPQLWTIAATKTDAEELDELQKRIVWNGLFSGAGSSLITIQFDGLSHDWSTDVPYDLLLLRSELKISILPTEECQFRYLTGTENYHSMKTNLGDLPFQLLVVIARHGAQGILNPDLARESGQDARSLRIRLQKLELAGLIICRNVYVDKKHTTHSVHTKFAEDTIVACDLREAEEDLDASRDVAKLKRHIIEAIKAAPNQLRGFSDLRKELKLDGSHSASKFFRSVCLKLHRSGFIEKLHVELPETKQRLYAVKFVKDLPRDMDDMSDIAASTTAEQDDFGESDEETPEDLNDQTPPVYNQIFPIFHQIYQHIYARKEAGITSGEIAKNLLGVSDYRPYTRLYEVLPTYLSNSKTLKPCKKYKDPYDNYTISKLYDNEGKLKFYRYSSIEFCTEEQPVIKPTKPKKQSVPQNSIVALNKRLHTTLGKTSKEALIEKRKRLVQITNIPTKRPLLEDEKTNTVDGLPEIPTGKRRTRTVKSYAVDPYIDGDTNVSGDDFVPDEDDAEEQAPSLKSNDLPSFVPVPKEVKRKRLQPQTYKSESSVKSITRRNLLVDIIRQEGGATFSSSVLCRKLDERMENSTVTDLKTLARDVLYLTSVDLLELQKVEIEIGGQKTEKKLLVLKNPMERPSDEALEELKGKYSQLTSRKDMKMFTSRVIQSDMKLYVETPNVKKVSIGTRKRRGKNRLRALDDEDDAPTIKSEASEDTLALEPPIADDVFSGLKKSRRAKKFSATQPSESSSSVSKRPRRNIKLDKSDATILYRSVVISKAFSREAIDFNYIATLVGDLDGKLVKQKWGTLRRLYGGAEAVGKGVETFKNMVLQGVEDGSITEEDLIKGELEFFLDYWKAFDTNTEFTSTDEMPLYATSEHNHKEYEFISSGSDGLLTNYSDKIEDISMRQKESVLGTAIFSYEANIEPVAKKNDELRSVLKAIFSTKEDRFDPVMVKNILNHYGEVTVREATDALLHDREILYVSLDLDTRFVLSDRFNNSFVRRGFTTKFFNQAFAFKTTLLSVSGAGKGLIVSQGVMPGEMAALLEMASNNLVDFIRIDRAFRFENYESRLIDKEQIACDIVVKCKHNQTKEKENAVIPVPSVSPCQPIWIDLTGQVNKQLWVKIITTLLYHIVFKPGIVDQSLHEKLQVVLSLSDYYKAIQWLIESGCITKDASGGYLATSSWQFILG